jgi:hypothetical protein
MNKILSTKRIVELFGSGYQLFYLLLEINSDGTYYFQIAPEAGSWVTGLGSLERRLFKENLDLTNDYAIIPQVTGDSKAISIKDVFYTHYADNSRSIFKCSAGTLNGKKVRSGKAFQIDVNLLENGVITKQWSIREIDLSKFRPNLKTKLGKEYYMGIFPAALNSEYKLLKDRIGFPKEAIQHNVCGKVFVKLFFDEKGNFDGYQLIKGLGYGIDEEVIKAINEFPVSGYPTGEKTNIILPFSFGTNKNTPVDISVKSFEFDPTAPYNNLRMVLINKVASTNSIKTKFSIYVFIDNELVFYSNQPILMWDPIKGMSCYFSAQTIKPYPGDETGTKFLPGEKLKPGTYEYRISLDPENVLNDVDRSNNIVRGKLVIK